MPYRHLDVADPAGARLLAAAGLPADAPLPVVLLPDGEVLRTPSLRELAPSRCTTRPSPCAAVVLATGVSYTRLPARGVDEFAGRGVYYGAATYEAVNCTDQDVYVVGAANSAGQAALFFRRYARRVVVLDGIEEATTRISTLVAAVKQYSFMDSAARQDVDLHTGLDSTVVMLGHKLAGVRVERDYDLALPRVPAYGAELNQVWTNLIDNAADAMAGTGRLVLRTSRDGDRAVVEVQDEGSGIPDDVRERVFEAFFTTKDAGRGSGLGLDSAGGSSSSATAATCRSPPVRTARRSGSPCR